LFDKSCDLFGGGVDTTKSNTASVETIDDNLTGFRRRFVAGDDRFKDRTNASLSLANTVNRSLDGGGGFVIAVVSSDVDQTYERHNVLEHQRLNILKRQLRLNEARDDREPVKSAIQTDIGAQRGLTWDNRHWSKDQQASYMRRLS
jgi:hypothetical protein